MKFKKQLVASAVACAIGAPALAATTIYNDRSAFELALSSFYVETFTNNMLNGSGASFVSSAGSIGTNRFNDVVQQNGGNSTTWSFTSAINGFGGNWDLSPGGAGSGIRFFLDGTTLVQGEVPRTFTGQFFGFISDAAFTSVKYDGGTQSHSLAQETHHLDNMTYGVTAVPEPETYAMMLAGLGLLGFAARRRKQAAAVA